jgi:mannose-6-phosphate isomerase-like protein (cupin superfamily)
MQKIVDLTKLALGNTNFRQVLATGPHAQVVVMSLAPGEEIGSETHTGADQILYLVAGQGTAVLGEEAVAFDQGDCILVAAGTRHNFQANRAMGMKIITIYAPATHADGLIHRTKAEAASE